MSGCCSLPIGSDGPSRSLSGAKKMWMLVCVIVLYHMCK